MPNIKPIVSDVSIGNVAVAIDCVWLKCIESFEFKFSQDEVPIICNWADGKVSSLRGNPAGDINIVALNLSPVSLQYALDAVVSTKSGDETVACQEFTGIDWVPDNIGTPTQWTATLQLSGMYVDDVLVYKTAGCTSAWASATTPLNVVSTSDCSGLVTLTTDDDDQCYDALYVSFTHDSETPDGATLVQPGFSTFASDHTFVAVHRNATTGEYVSYKFWRVQIAPDVTIRHDNTNKIVSVPIHLMVLADRENHPDAPLGQIEFSDGNTVYTMEPYIRVPDVI